MRTEITCVVCPVSCPVEVEWTPEEGITRLEYNQCKLAYEYVASELFDPRRTVTTSVRVRGGTMPLASVKSAQSIPKAQVFQAMDQISGLEVDAPIDVGDVILPDLVGTDIPLVATRDVPSAR